MFSLVFLDGVVTLDMLSRLKGIETGIIAGQCSGTLITLDMLSRLKGIETHSPFAADILQHCFGYAFPFEGN